MNIKICIPSYKRPKVETFQYLKTPFVYVDRKEYDDYVKANPGHEQQIIAVPDGIQGNLCRIRNYIMRTEFEAGADVVCIIDDDMKGLYLWQSEGITLKKHKLAEDEVLEILEKYSEICSELGYRFWGANCNMDPMAYMEYTPFSFSSYIGGPFQVFLKGNECYYDENLPLKEDYDMTLQQCNKYRGCLRCNFLVYDVKQSEQAGGCATYRNYERERKQFDALQKKWGSKIVKMDSSNKGRSDKARQYIDYNPIIKVPIKGI